MRREECVCGGIIVARRWQSAERAVAQHNMSLMHSVWRRGREGPTATVVIRDVSDCPPRASDPPAPRPRRVS